MKSTSFRWIIEVAWWNSDSVHGEGTSKHLVIKWPACSSHHWLFFWSDDRACDQQIPIKQPQAFKVPWNIISIPTIRSDSKKSDKGDSKK